MTDFKVGDRVVYEDETGVITHFDNHKIWIHWHRTEDDAWVTEDMIRPITDTPSENFAKQEASSFEQNVRRILSGIADTVSSKNLAYGDSALNPVRIFSKADRMEQLFVRLDDKLSRVQRGHEYPGDDTIRDIIGYCTLILIARESA